MTAQPSKQWIACTKCDHVWPLIDLPCPMGRLIEAMTSAKCPNCGANADSIVMASAPPNARGEIPAAASAWPGLPKWLNEGNRGISSETIVSFLTGIPLLERFHYGHPNDPADFARCQKLFEAVPSLAERIDELAALSPQWSRLVALWKEIVVLMDDEAPSWREGKGMCPSAYAVIKSAGREG